MHDVIYQNKVLWFFFYNPLIDQTIISILQKPMNNPGEEGFSLTPFPKTFLYLGLGVEGHNLHPNIITDN